MASITLEMKFEKQTKNTVKYCAIEELPPIEALYINKRDLREAGADPAYPSRIVVLVTFDADSTGGSK